MNIERVRAIYAEIEKYEIQLERDPRSLGPLYLQDTIATCRNYLNLVSRIQLEVHREKQEVSRRLRAAETAYDVAFADVLASDERVRRLPSIEDRKATANVILRESLSGITALKAELQDLEYVDKAVRHRHRELTSTMSEIKLQRALIRDEIDSGAMYGDERQFDHERKRGVSPDGLNEEELDALLAEETQGTEPPVEVAPHSTLPSPSMEQRVSPKPTPKPVPKPVQHPLEDEAKVREFLGGAGEVALEDEFDDLLNQI